VPTCAAVTVARAGKGGCTLFARLRKGDRPLFRPHVRKRGQPPFPNGGKGDSPLFRARRSTCGFTLAELLIVVAVIAILVALSIPVGGRAIDEANQVQCRANLRALGMAVLVYAKDNNGALPVSDVMDGPHPRLVAGLRPYVEDPRPYYCPSETSPERLCTDANFRAGRIGYFYYSCEKKPGNLLLSTFLRLDVAWPRRLYNTMPPRTWVASDAWFSGGPTAHRAYKKGVDYVTLGGDVQFLPETPREAFR